MPTATLTNLLTDINLCDSGNPTLEGSGDEISANIDADMCIQGTNCASFGNVSGLGSASPTWGTSTSAAYHSVTSFSGANQHIHIWLRCLYRMFDTVGIGMYLGDGTNGGIWKAEGSSYGGGWIKYVLDVDTTSPIAADINSGTEPNLATITQIGLGLNRASDKGEAFLQNSYFDAIRRGSGDNNGIRVTGGTGTGANALSFNDISAADVETDGTLSSTAYGIFKNRGGAYICTGVVQFGVAGGTCYVNDSNQLVNFADLPVSSNYYRIIANDATTGVTNLDLTSVTWKSPSASKRFKFDMSLLGTGDSLTLDSNSFIFGAEIKFGPQSTVSNCAFTSCSTIFPNGMTLTTPTFSACDAVTLTTVNDAISGGATNGHNTATGVGFITTDDLSKISNHSFDNTGGSGHAITLNTIGTYSFSGNTFTGYGVDGSNDAAIYNNSGGAVTINITGAGGTPTVRNGAGASTTINNAVTLTVTVVDSANNPVTTTPQVSIHKTSDNTEVMNLATDASGIATTSYNYTADTPVYVRVRDSSTGTRYKNFSTTGTITTNGFDLKVTLEKDPLL